MSTISHEPTTHALTKMDTPTGLWTGGCSCGWSSDSPDDQAGALRSARQHADAKALNESPDFQVSTQVWEG